MNKKDLAEKLVASQGLTKKQATEIVNEIFENVTKSVKKGETVEIFGFGKFELKKRAARNAKNPKTGAVVKVPATKVPAFKAAKAFKELVK